jgi:hypothetical protein
MRVLLAILVGAIAISVSGCVSHTHERVVEKQPIVEKEKTTIIERR